MTDKLLESLDTFKVNFGGEHKIDAELFTKTIDNTVYLVKNAANSIDPSCFLRLEIKANKEGSFETVIDAVAKYSDTLFTKENIDLSTKIIAGFLAFLQIKAHLKGKRAKKIEKNSNETKITNQDGKVISTNKSIATSFFKDATIDNSIVNIFKDLDGMDRGSFSIVHKKNDILFNKEDYNYMSQNVVDEKNSTSKLETQKPIEVSLLLKKPDLLGDSAWQFVYNKNISAKIDDERFLEKVHKGEIRSLYAGVRIPCLLQIEYELDEKFNPIPNSDKYTVLEVIGEIIEPDKNEELFDEKET
ncbi:MAG: hypothetical protein ACTSXQ_07590 [Alphaproteobacteria bacterium]